MSANTAFGLCVLILSVSFAEEDRRHNRFTIESRGDFTDTLIQGLRKLNFRLLYQITPSVYIFEYDGEKHTHNALKHVIDVFQDQITDIEPTRLYKNAIKQGHADNGYCETANLVCSKYYGMSVTEVWERNITGKGVTIAVNDVGINTDLIDLERNIDKKLSKNFLTGTADVTPETFPELVNKAPEFTDHGNKIASIIAAVKDNNICSAGIAYDATIIALKIYKIDLVNNRDFKLTPEHWTASDITARALVYEPDKIDIFVNAWAATELFDQLDLATRNAIIHGATKGRRGLGSIYVVPAGPCGNELSHNIHTISVSSIGRYGTQPFDAELDTSVLVSGLRDGNNLTASSIVTASHGNKCVTNFKGASVAVSQVSAIIALGLQANPKLTLRDVQHLLVQASYHEELKVTAAFRSNGAFRYFHNVFGFGLLNADKFVRLASNHTSVSSSLLSRNLYDYKKRTGYRTQTFEFYYICDIYSDQTCLTFIEHVTTSINFTTSSSHLRVEIISPSKTHSVLMVLKIKEEEKPLSKGGKLVSVHFWDEMPSGKWYITVQNRHSLDQTNVTNISLQIHGTGQTHKDHEKPKIGIIVNAVVACLIVVSLIIGVVWKHCRNRRIRKPELETSVNL